MALKMSFKFDKFPLCAESYWCVGNITQERAFNRARVVFQGYINEASRDADVKDVMSQGKVYDIVDDEYTALFSPDKTLDELISDIYAYAKAHKEGIEPPEDDPDNRVSFFNNAEDC